MRHLLLFLLLFLPTAATAGDGYDIAPIAPGLLNPPLPVRSPQWQADLYTVLSAQQSATAEQKAAATAEDEMVVEHITSTVDPKWTAETHPQTFAWLEKAMKTCKENTSAAKKFWNTNRPFVEDARVDNFIKRKPSGAYPSGHTACSRVIAEALGQVLPEKRPALRQRAADYAWHRVIAGVHYPHDLKGGEQLAMLLVGALQQNAAYSRDMAAARAEISQ